MSEIKTAAIIPAYNEEKTVGSVITAAMQAESIDAVVVVNDGSADATAARAKEVSGYLVGKDLAVISHGSNQGKTEALLTGVEHAQHIGGASLSTLLFIDADLSPIWSRDGDNRKLTQKLTDPIRPTKPAETRSEHDFTRLLASYIDQLVVPVADGREIMSIGMPERNRLTDALRVGLNWGALGGTRAVSLDMWQAMMRDCAAKGVQIHGWEIEAALNTYTRSRCNEEGVKLNRFIGKLLMTDVVNKGSRVKAGGFIPGLRRMAEIHGASTRAFIKYADVF